MGKVRDTAVGMGGGMASDLASNPAAAVLAPGLALPAAVLNNIPGAKDLISGITGPINRNGGILGQEGAAPEMAKIQQGNTVEDVRGAATRTGEALNSQNALLKALQGQGGLGMQNQAAQNQLGLANQLQAANGVGAQQGAISGLQNTAGMYQNIAQGNGPNPARAMLNQATGQNVANQAALMAGQRGAGANVGLMARQAAQQGANTQQQAVGQGATMQANQQLNALQGLTGAQQAAGNLGSGLTGQQMGANQAYANQGNTIAGQEIGANQANVQNNLANQGQVQNSLQGYNNANVAAQGSVNAANAALSQSNTAGKQAILGGILQGAGAAVGAARGGMVHMAEGGIPQGPMTPAAQPNMSVMNPSPTAVSSFGQFLNEAPPVDNIKASEDLVKKEADPAKFQGSKLEKGTASATSGAGGGLKAALAGSRGGLAKGGGPVNAEKSTEKAVKGGNSYSNDKIPAMLSEGEIVLPRSVTQSKNPKRAAADFVAQVLAKRKVRK